MRLICDGRNSESARDVFLSSTLSNLFPKTQAIYYTQLKIANLSQEGVGAVKN
jgi:hypothetical protein